MNPKRLDETNANISLVDPLGMRKKFEWWQQQNRSCPNGDESIIKKHTRSEMWSIFYSGIKPSRINGFLSLTKIGWIDKPI